MSENLFKIKEEIPDDAKVLEKLKSCYTNLEAIRNFIAESIGETKEEWKYYGAKYGWTMKNFLKKRNLYFIGIYDGFFKISFVFGERAYNAIMEADISEELKKELSEARKYAEGRGLSIDVHDDTYLDDIKKLLLIKIKN